MTNTMLPPVGSAAYEAFEDYMTNVAEDRYDEHSPFEFLDEYDVTLAEREADLNDLRVEDEIHALIPYVDPAEYVDFDLFYGI